MRVLGLSISAMLTFSLSLAQGNLLTNGGYESPVLAPGGFVLINPGSEPVGFGWTVNFGSVDLAHLPVSPFVLYSAFEGNQALDLNGNERGGVSQDFATIAGQAYQLTFAYADNPLEGGISSASVRVSDVTLNSTLLSTSVFHSTSTNSPANADYSFYSGTFTAAGSLTRLEFASTSASNSASGGILLDGVNVSAVPEPTATSLAVALGMAGIYCRRRLCRKSSK
jgi:choice-of-anchor C domain-containing protein